jgi:hypothetical protein
LSYTKFIHPEWVKGIISVFSADKDKQINTNVNKSYPLEISPSWALENFRNKKELTGKAESRFPSAV